VKRSAYGHTKLKKLMRRLAMPEYAVIGVLETLWHLTAREAPRGDIGRLSDGDIAFGIDWNRDPSELIDALVDCRWIDRCPNHRLVVHDWKDHADDATKKAINRNGWTFAVAGEGYTDESGLGETIIDVARLPKPEPEPKPSQSLPPFPPELDSDECKQAVSDWIEHRKQLREPATAKALEKLLKAWAKEGASAFVAAIEHSISSGWKGVFASKSPSALARASPAISPARIKPKEGKYDLENLNYVDATPTDTGAPASQGA
jgi:hypothetical protein